MTGQVSEEPDSKGSGRSARRALGMILVLVLAAGSLLFALSRFPATAPYITEASDYLRRPFMPEDTSLNLVVVYSDDKGEHSFINGIQMAVDEINASESKVLGRDIKVEFVHETGIQPTADLEKTVSETLKLSGSIARTENLLAVIGHEWSDTAVTASAIYAHNEILFLATHATATSLTDHDFDTVFALQPDNATNASLMATYALSHGLERVVVLSDKTDYGKESANFFTEAIASGGGNLVYRGFLSGSRRSVDDLLMFVLDNNLFKRTDFDAFFIVSSSIRETTEFIKRARYLGLNVPILGMEYMFSGTIETAVGKKDMKDVIGVSLYDRDMISEQAQAFAAKYQTLFGGLPDLNAALGYDAATLIRDAAARAERLDPPHIADILKVARYKEPFTGVTGPLVFDRDGLITDTHVFVVRHDGTEFRTVASFEIPLDRNTGSEDGRRDNVSPSNTQADALPSAKETGGQ